MNKKEIEEKVKLLKKELNDLENLLKEPEKSKEYLMEELFLSLIKDTTYKIKDEHNIWYNSENLWIINQDKKKKLI